MNYFRLVLMSLVILSTGSPLHSQTTRKVLFLGNSYTGVNDLPKLVHDVARSAGDILIFDNHTPGGYRLIDHKNDKLSRGKIGAANWDYVVLQGHSREPIIASSQFNTAGMALFNLIKEHNPCAVPMPFMTWGRKNGDASNCAAFPVMCTYQSMDSTLKGQYLNFTDNIDGEVSPVSVVWNYLRQNHPDIDLYQEDGTHPSAAGSYAAACCFYASIFKKDPTSITFNSVLNESDASAIRDAVKSLVFEHLTVWDYKKSPVSDFSYEISSDANEVIFSPANQSVHQEYFWDFGDGNVSSAINPRHSYVADGTYTVSLTTANCDREGNYTSATDTVIQF